MKKPLLLSILLILFTGCLFAQQPTGAITIFSEDGDKFFLVSNGQKQNAAAQTNVRVDGLTQQYYTGKVIFENQALGEISKNLMVATGGQPDLMDVTYKLKKDKNGKQVLRYFSAVAMQPNYVAPPDVYVMHFGAAAPAGGTISSTTSTTTTTTGNPTGMNVNVNGVNMSVTDPNMTTTTQTTRTTTTTNTGDPNMMMGGTTSASAPAATQGCTGAWPMNPGDFSSALGTVKKQGFDDTKLSTAKQIAGANCLDANQVTAICKEFGFEENKLKFAKFAYDHCTEPNNYFKINNVFGFSTSVDELNKYIQDKH